ncbi:hypothetical protein JK363_12775 [Streptomyces sp. 205]|uniref:PH domain-containing protein n=1 Tax=Streptomyces coffeae TaxID=621382 RepID=A0ABS1NCC7_9ACTN|nr:hypothetical protein [Streptomyces coffeae]
MSAHSDSDRRWRGDARCAAYCALTFVVLTTLLDWGSGGLTVGRADLWALIGAVVFMVLRPARVTAGDGWLAVRGLLCERRVRTDALVSVMEYGSISTRLVLRDAHGHAVELDPDVLVANPLLWHRLDAGARRSRQRGTLRHGAAVLDRLGERIDGGTAREILKASGLD